MSRGEKLLCSFPSLAIIMMMACSAAAAQGQATLQESNYSCSTNQNGGNCNVTIQWNDPSDPNPSDYVTQSEQRLGTQTVGEGDSGEYTAYDIESPAEFILWSADGQLLYEMECFVEAGSSKPSVNCN